LYEINLYYKVGYENVSMFGVKKKKETFSI